MSENYMTYLVYTAWNYAEHCKVLLDNCGANPNSSRETTAPDAATLARLKDHSELLVIAIRDIERHAAKPAG